MPSTMPSSWAAGAGLGLCLASIIAMGALDAHMPIPWARCLAVIVACFGGVPSLEFFLRGTWAIVRTVGETLAQSAIVPLVDDSSYNDDDASTSPVVESNYDPELSARKLAIETFFLAGNKAGGFSIDKLSGCVGSDTWDMLTKFYCSDASGRILQVRGGNVGTVWNNGQGLDLVLHALKADALPLPPGPVPYVQPLPSSAAQRNTTRKSAKHSQSVIIEN